MCLGGIISRPCWCVKSSLSPTLVGSGLVASAAGFQWWKTRCCFGPPLRRRCCHWWLSSPGFRLGCCCCWDQTCTYESVGWRWEFGGACGWRVAPASRFYSSLSAARLVTKQAHQSNFTSQHGFIVKKFSWLRGDYYFSVDSESHPFFVCVPNLHWLLLWCRRKQSVVLSNR